MFTPMDMDQSLRKVRQPSGVIEMQMRQDNVLNSTGWDSPLRQLAHRRCVWIALQAKIPRE